MSIELAIKAVIYNRPKWEVFSGQRPGEVWSRAAFEGFGTFQVWRNGRCSGAALVTREWALADALGAAEYARARRLL